MLLLLLSLRTKVFVPTPSRPTLCSHSPPYRSPKLMEQSATVAGVSSPIVGWAGECALSSTVGSHSRMADKLITCVEMSAWFHSTYLTEAFCYSAYLAPARSSNGYYSRGLLKGVAQLHKAPNGGFWISLTSGLHFE